MKRDTGWILGVFVLSRLAYAGAGIRFDTVPLRYFWQLVDPVLLREQPFESIWWLHSQPPLFNLGLALVFQLPEEWQLPILNGIFMLLGLALGLALVALQRRLGVPRGVRIATTTLLLVSPAAVLYENHLFYTWPVAAALPLAAVLLHRFAAGNRLVDGLACFGLLAAVALTHSLWHLLWLVAIVVATAGLLPGRRHRVVLAALPALVLVSGWYLRNWILFGTFAASTWGGMSLAQMPIRLLPDSERQELAALAPEAAILSIPAFSPVADYGDVVERPPVTGIPLLDQPRKANGAVNYHHLAYVSISGRYAEAARWLLRHRPALYLRAVGASWLLFFDSAANSPWLSEDNRGAVAVLERPYRTALYWQRAPLTYQLGFHHVGWGLVALTLVPTLWALRRGWAAGRAGRQAEAVTLVFLSSTVLYVVCVGTLFELGENNRFRFMVEPLGWALAGVLIGSLPPPWRSFGRRARSSGEPSAERLC